MNMPGVFACAAVSAVVLQNASGADSQQTFKPRIDAELSDWAVEQMPDGSVTARDGVLDIRDKGGCTVWLRRKLFAPVEISYEAMAASDARVSDVNCFWMARDPRSPDDFFAGYNRTGAFATYDNLMTYYVGLGGNDNTTTRLRRYPGDGSRPLLPQHDLRDRKFLLEGNRWYRITLIARDGSAKFLRDGEMLFDFKDPQFLSSGWFGIRTVSSHLRIRNVRVSIGTKPSDNPL